MGKKEELIKALKPLLSDRIKLAAYITSNSNLPGPRGNLELAFALAEIYEDFDTLQEWITITENQAGVNDPKAFLPFCAAVCLGKVYIKTKRRKIISILQHAATDGRWRMREAVAFGFQFIGENDFNELKTIFSAWIKNSTNLEKRAILVSLAHPPMLDRKTSQFCFDITDNVLHHMDRDTDFTVLKKGLQFTISVFAAADPGQGFRFIRKWTGKDRTINTIMKENLKKNRLVKKHPEEVAAILTELQQPLHADTSP